MPDLKELVVRLRADASGYDKGAKQAQKDNEDVKKSSKGLGDGFISGAKAALGFAGTLAGLAGINLGIQGITGAISSTIGAAEDAQNTMAQTNAVLKSTHDVSGQTAQSINNFADAQMRLTGIDDQAIQGAENMIATFTNIKGNVFPGATKAVEDMATSMNGGAIPSAEQLRQTAIQVGKALNDPVQGVSALQRVGVKLSATQLDQVKHFMAVGDTAKAQGIILGELSKEFGGAAEAAGSTFTGKLAIAQGMLQNVQETIGGAVLPILTNLLQAVQPVVQIFADALPGAIAAVQSAFGGLKLDSSPLASLGALVHAIILPALQQFGGFLLSTVLPAVKQLFGWFASNVLPILGQLAGVVLGTVLPAIGNLAKIVIGQVVPSIQKLWNFLAPQLVPVFQFLGNVLKNVVVPALTSLLSGVAGVINFIASNDGVLKTLEITLGIIGVVILASLVPAFIAWAAGAAAAAIATIAATWPILAVIAVIALIVAAILFLVSHWSQIGEFLGNVFGKIGEFFGNLFGIIGGFVGNILGKIGEFKDMILKKIGEFITGAVKFFHDLPGKIWTHITEFTTGLLLRIGKLELDGLKKIGDFIGGIIKWFQDLPGKVWTWITNLATGILLRVGQLELDGLKKVGDFIGGIVGFFQSLPGKVVALVENLRSLAIHKFDDLKNGIGNALTGMKNTATNIWNGVVGVIKGAINTIISDINGFINAINKVSIHIPSISVGPVTTPAFNWNGPHIPTIPKLAAGGIATRPTLAVIGEAGPEAVIPLSRMGGKGFGGNTYVTNVYPAQHSINAEDLARIQRRRELLIGMRG